VNRWSLLLLACSGPLSAQEVGRFLVIRDNDTVAVEEYARDSSGLRGTLVRLAGPEARERLRYRATVLPDQSAPLLEVSAWRAADPMESPARQTARMVFKDDSVAVDDVTRWDGARTRILPTTRAAIPYLNLSTAWLEQATRRAAGDQNGSESISFFNLGGGQTVEGLVWKMGADSAGIRIGSVEFRLQVDSAGRILGGGVPAQRLRISRLPG
jgi:hypothetical protein